MQLSGLLPTDPEPQEQELLCRAIELGLTVDQFQGADLSCCELWVRQLQMLEMKLRDKVAESHLGGSGQPHLSLDRTDTAVAHDRARTGGVRISLAKDTAAAKDRRKLRGERAGAPPAGGQKK